MLFYDMGSNDNMDLWVLHEDIWLIIFLLILIRYNDQ